MTFMLPQMMTPGDSSGFSSKAILAKINDDDGLP